MKFTVEHRRKISEALSGKETWLGRLKNSDYPKFLEHQQKAGKKGAESCRKSKRGCFFNKELQSKAGKIAHQKHDYGIIFRNMIKQWKERDPEGYTNHQKYAGQRALELHPDLHYNFGNNYGAMGGRASAQNPDNIKRRIETLDKFRKTPQFTLVVMRNLERYRRNKRQYFRDVYFSSVGELEVAKQILKHGLEEELVKRKNCHIIIPTNNNHFREFDFFIRNRLFVEYHPYDPAKLSIGDYYRERRKILNENGFADKDLVVLKHINEFSQKVVAYFK